MKLYQSQINNNKQTVYLFNAELSVYTMYTIVHSFICVLMVCLLFP